MPELNLQKYLDQGIALAVEYAPKVVLALLIWVIGGLVVRGLMRGIERIFQVRGIDATLRPFLTNLASWFLKLVLAIIVVTTLGIPTASLVAIVGAAGLAVGLALQGSLANFAGGVLILIFRPFEVGHLISAQGITGVVQEIQVFATTVVTPENRRVVIPNAVLSNGSVTNFTAEGKLRVDLTIGVSYGADLKKAKETLLASMKGNPKVLDEPAPLVAVKELADSSVNLAVRPWATPADYWDVYFGVLEDGKVALDEAGIEIPLPQRVIHQA